MNRYILSKLALLFLFMLPAQTARLSAQNINNPVLSGVADAGVIKYNGKYYIGGVYTDGDFHVSEDLVNWSTPVHVFDMDNDWTRGTGAGNNQIHANDMIYLNGKFHLYWSVNHWGNDKHIVHIAHAESDNALGPYIEPVKDTWMDNRIDPHVFKDDDGRLYMYMVRFTDGNTIWVRPMKDPYSFSGEPFCLFASLPDTWETMDNRVAEGPWVIKYRGQYYMMYNANHTGTAWGNYQLGVAQADSPLLFNNGNKYSHPLFLSNQMTLEDNYTDVLRLSETYNPYFTYTTELPERNWKEASFDDSTWKQGEGGFASQMVEGSTVRRQGTVWESSAIFLRKAFSIDKKTTGNLTLRILHDGDTQVYINGKQVYAKAGADYILYPLNDKDKTALKDGRNILAVESKTGRRNYINISLFNMREEAVDDILFTPGQPNIVRGPNGFEWWLVYMANKNMERRSQYINRLHFHGKVMHAEGITASKTKGYHPEPTKATFSHLKEFTLQGENEWLLPAGTQPATSYLFETGVKTTSTAGIIAWKKDEANWIRIGLKAPDSWYVQQCTAGQLTTQAYPLPEGFRFGVYHKLSVERNVGNFSFRIDDIPAPGCPLLQTSITEEGITGVFSEEGDSHSYDGIAYTIGWDEYDHLITAWDNASPDENGLTAKTPGFNAFKGDKLSQYEYSVQVTNAAGRGKCGAYPVYIDKDNYVKAYLDYDKQCFVLESAEKGKKARTSTYPLAKWTTKYPDVKYTDFIEKGYRFHTPVWIDGIRLSRFPVDGESRFEENMFGKVSAEYFDNGRWLPLPVAQVATSENLLYSEARLTQPVYTNALRFINKEPEDQNRHIYKIGVKEKFNTSYNLRFVKRAERLLVFVNGDQVTELPLKKALSQVGLYTEDVQASFNGITRYHIPE